MGRGEDPGAAAEASLPAFGKCAGVGAGRDSRGAGTALLEAEGSGTEGMSVSSQANSLTARFARWVLAYAVRYWPEGEEHDSSQRPSNRFEHAPRFTSQATVVAYANQRL